MLKLLCKIYLNVNKLYSHSMTNKLIDFEEKTLIINHIGTIDPAAIPTLVFLALGPFIYTLEDYQKITKLYMDLFL